MPSEQRDPIRRPSFSDYAEVLRSQNPWLTSPTHEVPGSLARDVERPLARALYWRLLDDAPRRFHLILGPRRVGKTTVMYQTVRHLLREGVTPRRVRWLRVDHPLLMEASLGDLVRGIIESVEATPDAPLFLFLDELIYARDWDLWLKTFFDDNWPVRITATSSAAAALKNRRAESGVGRWVEHHLPPYSFTEFLDLTRAGPSIETRDTLRTTLETLDPATTIQFHDERTRFLLTGGFPELLVLRRPDDEPDNAERLLESQSTLRTDAIERAIYRDIPQAYGVEKPMALERLLYTLASQVTGVLSPANICSKLQDLSQPTLDRYLSYLEHAYIVFTLQNYSGQESSRQRRGRKLYFYDSAVRNAALQRGLGPLHDPVEMGQLLENLVASQIHALALQTQVRCFHWRDGADEIDLIYDHPTSPLAFEIASSTTHPRRGMLAFMKRHPRFEGACYLVAPNAALLRPDRSSDRIGSIPTDLLLIAAGRLAEQAMRDRLRTP